MKTEREFTIHATPVEKNNMADRIKKPFSYSQKNEHTVLTDDVFTYVDFYFKTHKKNLRYLQKPNCDQKIKQNFTFFWSQAKNFYDASKQLPIESLPLTAYYCMLNAVKAYILYKSKYVDEIMCDLGGHGLHESNNGDSSLNLSAVCIKRDRKGVFPCFSKMLDPDFDFNWEWISKANNKTYSMKELFYQLAFVHRAYFSTYNLPRYKELFVPLPAGKSPTFYKGSDGKTYLVAELQKSYFPLSSVSLPKDVKDSLPDDFKEYSEKDFKIISIESIKFKESSVKKQIYRRCFSYIKSDSRLWYLKKASIKGEPVTNLNELTVIFALMHRFSEIVRYKPEQLDELLKSKENWLIHEFLSLALDQFIDEIACEITGQEIMSTGKK